MPRLEDGSIGINITHEYGAGPQFFTLVGPTLVSAGGGGRVNTNSDGDPGRPQEADHAL
jgi:hypothetical protein